MKCSEKALENFYKGYNCAQSVLCAFSEQAGLDEETAFKIAEGFGLGMGGYKDECGAVTGMFMTIGLKNSDGVLDGTSTTKKDTYAILREAGKDFEGKTGAIMCRDLLAMEKEMAANASPEEIKAACGKALICVKCVKTASEYLENNII